MKDGAISAVLFDDGTLRASPGTPDLAWWSVTKLALAAAALRLAHAGRLDLDAGVEGAGGASLRALLGHRARIANYSDLPEYRADVARGIALWSAKEMLARVAALPSPAGWAYSNTGYYLVRRAIERAADAPIGRALDDLVLTPLGIPEARIAHRGEEMAALALPAPDYDPGWVYHGCLIGPPASAARLVAGILAGPILPSEARAAMREATPVRGAGSPWIKAGYGLGLMTGLFGAGAGAEGDPEGQARGAGAGALAVEGHSGGGPGSGCAVYRFTDLPGTPTIAVFAAKGACEARALTLARGREVAPGGLARAAGLRVERR